MVLGYVGFVCLYVVSDVLELVFEGWVEGGVGL